MPKRGSRLHKDLRAIGKAFKALAHHFERIAPLLGEHEDVVVTDSPRGKRRRHKPRLTAARLSALKLHGKYIGTIRMLPAAKKAKVKKIRSENGVRAAIAYASKMASYLMEVPERTAAKNDRRPRRKPRLTAAHRTAMKLQGKYMGTMRALNRIQRAKVKEIRARKGVRAAIAAAKRFAV